MPKVRDFQEFLNEELLKDEKEGIINKYYKELIIALDEKEKNSQEDKMQELFFESIEKTNKDDVFEIKNDENGDESSKLLGEDELIVPSSSNEQKDENEQQVEGVEEIQDISDEELDEKYPGDDLSKNAKRYAYTYEKVMEQYFKLKLDLEKQNIKKGQYSYDDKHFSQLMRLKAVAIKYEIYFRNATSSKYFAVRDSIESVKQMEEKYKVEIGKYQDENNRVHQKQNTKVQDVVNQIESCLKKIEELNEEIKDASPDKKFVIINELSHVKDMYINLNKKLELIQPDPKQLAIEEYKSRSQSEYEDKVDGVHYSKYVNRYAEESSINNAKFNSKEKKRDEKEERLDENGALNSINDALEKVKTAKNEAKEAVNKEIESGNLDVASELLDSYVGSYKKDFNTSDKEEIEEVEKIKERIDEARKRNELGDRVKSSDELSSEDASSSERMDELDKLSKGEIVSQKQPDLGLSR